MPENNRAQDHYSFDEIWECQFDDYYLNKGEFGITLTRALVYLPKDTTDKILELAFFVSPEAGSLFVSQSLIKDRGVVLIHRDDLENGKKQAIITILHEAGHAFLGHSKTLHTTPEVYEREEDECWNQVRKWLPDEFQRDIDTLEKNGGGSRGLGYLSKE